jgi:hypothetical protein
MSRLKNNNEDMIEPINKNKIIIDNENNDDDEDNEYYEELYEEELLKKEQELYDNTIYNIYKSISMFIDDKSLPIGEYLTCNNIKNFVNKITDNS